MFLDLLLPLRAVAGAALTVGAVVLAAAVLLLLARDLAQTRFSDGTRDEG